MTGRHLFFDLDGTVTDSREGIVKCISHALATMQRPVPPQEELERFIGPPLAPAFEVLLGTKDDATIRFAIETYRERYASIGMFENRVYPDMAEALGALRGRALELYLLTSKPKVYASRILQHFGLSSCFTRVYGPDLADLRGTKSSLLRHALVAEAVDASTAVVIGDRKDDVLAARENGAGSIGVTWGHGSREELETAGADHVVASVSELVSLLSR